MTDPVPGPARAELKRLVARWHQLPVDQALHHVPGVRELAQQYADEAARARGLPPQALPDLGPSVVMDQLTVTVYDVYDVCEARARAPQPQPGMTGMTGMTGMVDDQAAGDLAVAGDLAALRRQLP